MVLFDEDPFEEILRDFFGTSPARRGHRERFMEGESEETLLDFIEDDHYMYLILELPGFDEGDIQVNIRGDVLNIRAQKKSGQIQDYLHQKLQHGFTLKKQLPVFVNPKNFSHTMKHGILELIFNKLSIGARDGQKRTKNP